MPESPEYGPHHQVHSTAAEERKEERAFQREAESVSAADVVALRREVEKLKGEVAAERAARVALQAKWDKVHGDDFIGWDEGVITLKAAVPGRGGEWITHDVNIGGVPYLEDLLTQNTRLL